MHNKGDYIIYLKDVCKIADIKLNYMNNTDYYVLVPINDDSLKLNIPVNNKSIRCLLTKDEVEEIIENMNNVEVLSNDDRTIESEYKRLIQTGNHEDLVKVIKTTYLRNKKRLDMKRKISDVDRNYFELAEKYLYTEFAVVLNKSFDETKEYIDSKMSEVLSNE